MKAAIVDSTDFRIAVDIYSPAFLSGRQLEIGGWRLHYPKDQLRHETHFIHLSEMIIAGLVGD